MRGAEIEQRKRRSGNHSRRPDRITTPNSIGRVMLDIVGEDGTVGLLGKLLDQLAGASDRIVMAPGVMETDERRLMMRGLSGIAIQWSRFHSSDVALGAYLEQYDQRNRRQPLDLPNPRLAFSTACGQHGSHFEFDLASGLYRFGARHGELANEQAALEELTGPRTPYGELAGAYLAHVDGWERVPRGVARQEFAHIATELNQQADHGQLIVGPMQVFPTV